MKDTVDTSNMLELDYHGDSEQTISDMFDEWIDSYYNEILSLNNQIEYSEKKLRELKVRGGHGDLDYVYDKDEIEASKAHHKDRINMLKSDIKIYTDFIGVLTYIKHEVMQL